MPWPEDESELGKMHRNSRRECREGRLGMEEEDMSTSHRPPMHHFGHPGGPAEEPQFGHYYIELLSHNGAKETPPDKEARSDYQAAADRKAWLDSLVLSMEF